MTPDDPALDEADTMAAEFALGVLEGADRAVALRRLLADPDFARHVADWRERLGWLYAEVAEVRPSPALTKRVLHGRPSVMSEARGGAAIRRWQIAAGAASAAAAALLTMSVLRPPPPVPAPPLSRRTAPALIALVTPEDGAPFAAVYDRGAGEVRLADEVAVPDDRDAELWAIGADGVPHAIGLLRDRSARRLFVRGVAIGPGTTLAISIEPVGGSPGQAPTGPVIATGKLTIV